MDKLFGKSKSTEKKHQEGLQERRGGEEGTRGEGLQEGQRLEVPLAQEKLYVGKRPESAGEVTLKKHVIPEQVHDSVNLRHEDVIVERTEGGRAQPGAEAFKERTERIPVYSEEAVVEKRVESAGAVQARKVADVEQKGVTGTVRHEEVEVERADYGARR